MDAPRSLEIAGGINISRIEAGQEEIVLFETVLNEQLRFVHSFFSSEAELKGQSISIDCPLSDKEARIVCDKEKGYAVLAQTAFALESDKKKYASLFDNYLTKPFHESELRKALNDALK